MHWICWFYVKKKKFIRVYKFIFSKWLWKEWQNNIKIFSIIKKWQKLPSVICVKNWKFEEPKISYFLEKTLVRSIIFSKCKNEDEKMLKKKIQLKY